MGACYSRQKTATGELLRRTGLASRRIEEVCDLDKEVVLGKGSFGTVYRAEMRRQPRDTVAVKVLDKRQMRSKNVPQKLVLTEVALMKLCRGHPRFVQIHEFLDGNGAYYIVMELCTGGDLQQAMQTWCQTEPLSEVHVARLMVQLLEGVQFLHAQKVCHRDIKPQNTMLSAGGRDATLKIADFGIALQHKGGDLLREKLGTPAFMAPEQHQLPASSRGYDHKVDIWASGVTMVFLLAHQLPFLDAEGRLIREQLLKGEVPLWASGAFSGLFQRVGEAVGLSRPPPSQSAQDMVGTLLSPSRADRPEAAQALRHAWCAQPGPEGSGGGGSSAPGQGWDEFARGLAATVEQEVAQFTSRVEEEVQQFTSLVMDTVGQMQRALDPAPSADRCANCDSAVRLEDWKCQGCEKWICARCLADYPRATCILCAHEDPGASISRALGLAELRPLDCSPSATPRGPPVDDFGMELEMDQRAPAIPEAEEPAPEPKSRSASRRRVSGAPGSGPRRSPSAAEPRGGARWWGAKLARTLSARCLSASRSGDTRRGLSRSKTELAALELAASAVPFALEVQARQQAYLGARRPSRWSERVAAELALGVQARQGSQRQPSRGRSTIRNARKL